MVPGQHGLSPDRLGPTGSVDSYSKTIKGFTSMTRKQIIWAIAPMGLIVLVGCATQSGRSSHSGAVEAKRSSKISVVLKPLPDTMLQQAATNRSAPFEGEGWQPMF